MKSILRVLPAVVLFYALALISPAALAGGGNDQGGNQGGNSQGGNGGNRAAPAPLIGASIPGLAIGYGVYWVIRRRRSSKV
jgi:hypothetical protein